MATHHMTAEGDSRPNTSGERTASLFEVARSWTRIGCTGFGGPPAHISLLRQLCVRDHRWLTATEFEDAVATVNLLPGPASTQLAIVCAWRVRQTAGALLGGLCFILPGLVLILGLSALFLSGHPPPWVQGAAAGAGAEVPAVAVAAAAGLAPPSWRRIGASARQRGRWIAYAVLGALAGATIGSYLVLVIAACGAVEVVLRTRPSLARLQLLLPPGLLAVMSPGGMAALAWTAFKVGALSYGGGFVIVPLMQQDAVHRYHWMTNAQFLNAVALGQLTPGPVVQTVAVVGYAAGGLAAGVAASAIAFAPSFVFVLAGARHFDRVRANRAAQAFLTGAGPAAIGAIAGAALPLGLALGHLWQVGVLAAAGVSMLALRRGVVGTLLGAGALGIVLALAGMPVS